ncbi:MAG: hypothetical protein ACYDHN_08720 [Solirubrobacteraceae bacterium]
MSTAAGSIGEAIEPPREGALGAAALTSSPEAAKPEPSWGAWVVIAGLVAVVVIFGVAVLRYKAASEVTTAVGAVSGVIAALVGAYFGIRGATLAQTKVEASSASREEKP